MSDPTNDTPTPDDQAREFATKAVMCTHAGIVSLALPLIAERDSALAKLEQSNKRIVTLELALEQLSEPGHYPPNVEEIATEALENK